MTAFDEYLIEQRDKVAAMIGTRVRHAYTGDREGTVTRVFVTRSGKSRITVAWDRGKSATHDMSLIRLV